MMISKCDRLKENGGTPILQISEESLQQQRDYDMKIPTQSQALQYFDEFKVPGNIKKHCQAVQRYANFLAKNLIEAGLSVNVDVVDRLALLHDLFKAVTIDLSKVDPVHTYVANDEELTKWRELREKFSGMHESQIAFEFFKDDFPQFASSLKNTSNPLSKKSTEELIVHYIDWRMFKDMLVSLDERLKYLYDRYPKYRDIYQESANLIKGDEKVLFSKLSFNPEKLQEKFDLLGGVDNNTNEYKSSINVDMNNNNNVEHNNVEHNNVEHNNKDDNGNMVKKAVVFGSSATKPDQQDYGNARAVGKLLAEHGYVVFTGGYEGIMCAVSKGVREANGQAIGVTCKQLQYVPPNAHLSKEINADTLLQRLDILTKNADLFVVMPGASGTLTELMLTYDLMGLKIIDQKPIVLFGSYWKPVINHVIKLDNPIKEQCSIVHVNGIDELRGILN